MKLLLSLCLLGTSLMTGVAASRKEVRSTHEAPKCANSASTLSLSDPPYDNYFYSDCNVAAQVVVTSPLPDSDLSLIAPRLIIAWPAGDSGACAYFAPQNGVNGSLSLELINSTIGKPLAPIYTAELSNSSNTYPSVGVQGVLRFNSSATLTVPVLGSIRSIREFSEGSVLRPEIQDAIKFTSNSDGSASLQRLWFDNVTTTSLHFRPWNNGSNSDKGSMVSVDGRTVKFETGDYLFSAEINYPQLSQTSPTAVLNENSQELISSMPDQTKALSFMSYSSKVLAGAWHYLTYFGRDSMITALLLEPVLSVGNASVMEAVIGSVLERVDRTDGSVCHEETIGDYATWSNLQNNIPSNAMGCDYKMIDSDYFLPILMQRYFLQNSVGQQRIKTFFNTPAGSANVANRNLTFGDLALINAERIMRLAGPFAHNSIKKNLIHLKEGQDIGQWRDSEYGIGGGRIPYDVNTALVPAALRSIASLAQNNSIFSGRKNWSKLANAYATVWEDKTLEFFRLKIPRSEAQSLVKSYVNESSFAGPNQVSSIDDDVTFYALALDGNDKLSKVKVMNTDDCFRHFLLNTTNNAQLTPFLNQTANNIRRTFPAGLMTDAGMIVANPAFGGDPVYAKNWTTGAYHGTVIWSWQLAMMAKGLEMQLERCELTTEKLGHNGQQHAATPKPKFCSDKYVYDNVKAAYNELWNSIEKNTSQLSAEVWSWVYRDDGFQVTPLGVLPPPGGGSQIESNIQQLWSLAFLAVSRNKAYKD
ncbi:hypothetical protein CBS147355_9441 [Penicillium roqueforti]|nr:hypothetical protein CBS147355_9441 [Penicillium roqueforti]KAI3247021.1 hypothetical protein CBS147309_8781 [Penicillium roqueforti]